MLLSERRAGRRLLNLAFGVVVSAGLGYLASKDVDWSELATRLREARPGYLVAALTVGALAALLKAVRWGVLLGGDPPIRLRVLFTTMMIGYLANNFLPARAGELVRVHLLQREAGVSRVTGLTTVIVERLVDAVFLLCLVAGVSLAVPIPMPIRQSIVAMAVVLAILTILLFALSRHGESWTRPMITRVQRCVPRFASKLGDVPARLVAGLGMMRRRRTGAVVLLMTVLIWMAEGFPVLLTMRSLNIGLSFTAALFLLAVISLSAILPAGPGAVGSYEFFAVLGLAPFGISGSRALGLALVLHVVNYCTVGALGLASLWMDGLKLKRPADFTV